MRYGLPFDAYPAPFSPANSAFLMERVAFALHHVSLLMLVSALLYMTPFLVVSSGQCHRHCLQP